MDPKKSNKIQDVVRLQRILTKWKKLTVSSPKSGGGGTLASSSSSSSNCNKSIKFLKRTLSFSDHDPVPKGYLAMCVGKELKRFVIPMAHLSHPAFGVLLQEAEDEFGFEQEGVLKIPCEVALFEKILKAVEDKGSKFGLSDEERWGWCQSPDSELTPNSCDHPQPCR